MSKPKNTRIKRLPEHSHTIIFKFDSKPQREVFEASLEYESFIREITALLATCNSNSEFEQISWDVVTGSKTKGKDIEIETQEITP